MMKDADISGYFTNHSAHRTGGMRLFQAGVDHKLVQEATSHHSDAVDKYQLTSNDQRRKMSQILARKPSASEGCAPKSNAVEENNANVTVNVSQKDAGKSETIVSEVKHTDVIQLINGIINNKNVEGKTVIKLEIVIHHE